MDKLIYLASPYSSEFADVTERRVRQVESAAAHFIEKGHLIFSPIVHSHPIAESMSFSSQNNVGAMSPWMKYDHAMIDKSDELWVLMLPEWDKSLGVADEIDYALKQGKVVRYIEYPTFRETGNIQRGKSFVSAYFQAVGRTKRTPFTPRFATWEGYKIPDAFKSLFEPPMYGDKNFVDALIEDITRGPFFADDNDTMYQGESIPQADGDNGEFFSRTAITDTNEFKKAMNQGAYSPPSSGKPYEKVVIDEPGHIFECKDCSVKVDVTSVRCGGCTTDWKQIYAELRRTMPRFFDYETGLGQYGRIEKPKAKQTIIGLNGVAQSGKDTVGEKLVDEYGFVRVSFADPIRIGAYDINPWISVPIGLLNALGLKQFAEVIISGKGWVRLQKIVNHVGWDKAKSIPDVRDFLQKVGTEGGRDVHGGNCWINIAKAQIEAAYPNPVIITDCRFPNEVECVRELGGKVVKVTRADTEAVNGHSSEQVIDPALIDYNLFNAGESLIDFHSEIDLMMESEFLKYE